MATKSLYLTENIEINMLRIPAGMYNVEITDTEYILNLSNFYMGIKINLPCEKFNSLFIEKELYESAIKVGSEIKILTNNGIRTYSVESIDEGKGGNHYIALSLEAID